MAQDMDFTLIETFFHISPNGAAHPLYELPAVDFLNPEISRATLLKAGEMVNAIGMQLATSFVGMSFSIFALRISSSPLNITVFWIYHYIISRTSWSHMTIMRILDLK